MRMQRGVALAMLVLAVVGACVGVHQQQESQSAPPSADINALLAKGMEARGEAALGSGRGPRVQTIMGVRGIDGMQRRLAEKISIVPVEALDTWNSAAEFVNGRLVAVVTLEDGELPLLHLTKGINLIYLYSAEVNGRYEWQARVANESIASLAIARFTYKRLDDPADYPGTARLDWTEANGVRTLVLGVRCAKGWCLIGTDKYSESVDLTDPDTTGDKHIANYRRVRGWFDRKPLGDGSYAYIYPGKLTSTIGDQEDYEKAWRHSISVRVGTDEKSFEISRPKFWHLPYTRRWRARPEGGHDEASVRHHSFTGKMPAAARWGASHTDFSVPRLPPSAAKRVAQPLGDAWVRCASGCCSTSIAF